MAPMNGGNDNSSGCALLGCEKDIAVKTVLAVAEAAGARLNSRLQPYRDPNQSTALALEVPAHGTLMGLSAIARYLVAESSAQAPDGHELTPTTHMPATFQRKRVAVTETTAIDAMRGVVDGWIDIACYELLPAVDIWLSMDSMFSPNKATKSAAQTSILQILSALETHLAANSFLIRKGISLADVMLVCLLSGVFKHLIGAQQREETLSATMRWYSAGRAHPCVEKILGKFEPSNDLCSDPEGWPANSPLKGLADPPLDDDKAAKKAAKLAEKQAKAEKLKLKKQKQAEMKKDSKDAKPKAPKKKVGDADEEALPPTPPGEKKILTKQMQKSYNPKAVESSWYDWWDAQGFFGADPSSDKPKFVIVIPPPNVTGSLHLGHALTNSIEDMIVRWRRMCGYEALWVPGTDHAGIATQTVVEKKLMREGVSRHDLGREKFVQRVYEWKDQYGNKIYQQLRRIGSSVDWKRESFTMSAKLSKAVKEAFVRMYDEGLIYRENRLVNWCCTLQSAISEIEVDYITIDKRTMISVPGYGDTKVEFGAITSFAYPLEDGQGEIVVATTRPETMLADTAVAVHPDDSRYKALHGKFVTHPFTSRKLPIITDAILVDMTFGTGAVKITPGHDPNDFATGQRHNLQFINMFTNDGFVNENGGEFKGMKRFDVRVKVVEALKDKGLFRGVADNPMRLGLCSRTKDVIEPVMKPQWWVNCTEMAAEGVKAAKDGRLEFLPSQYEAEWFRWLENIRDWCVSRQLWWGHRIPAYYVTFEGGSSLDEGEDTTRWVVARDDNEARERAEKKFAGKKIKCIEQDPDVLDTWFSSGLFPFSVFGWPEETADLSAFYPTSLLETGHDILFFWVARMVMLGMKLTGEVPFKQVYLHSMVRDAHGRKMSKSLGNVIDPLEVINGATLEDLYSKLYDSNLDPKEVDRAKEGQRQDFPNGIAECGTDAMRFALVSYTSQGRDINLDIQRVVGYRLWCNKLWNAIRFAMLNLGSDFIPSNIESFETSEIPFPCKWVLSKLHKACLAVDKAMQAYDFSEATTAVYDFWQYKLCDVFIEAIKPYLAEGNDEGVMRMVRQTLWICLDQGLKFLHPFMPYVTEELWQRLPHAPSDSNVASIMIAEFPRGKSAWVDESVEATMDTVDKIANATRSIRASYNLAKSAKPEVLLLCKGDNFRDAIELGKQEIQTLGLVGMLNVISSESEVPTKGCGVAIINDQITAYVVLAGSIDVAEETNRLDKRESELRKSIENLKSKMDRKGYQERTPENIKAENLQKLAKLSAEIEATTKAIQDLALL